MLPFRWESSSHNTLDKIVIDKQLKLVFTKHLFQMAHWIFFKFLGKLWAIPFTCFVFFYSVKLLKISSKMQDTFLLLIWQIIITVRCLFCFFSYLFLLHCLLKTCFHKVRQKDGFILQWGKHERKPSKLFSHSNHFRDWFFQPIPWSKLASCKFQPNSCSFHGGEQSPLK